MTDRSVKNDNGTPLDQLDCAVQDVSRNICCDVLQKQQHQHHEQKVTLADSVDRTPYSTYSSSSSSSCCQDDMVEKQKHQSIDLDDADNRTSNLRPSNLNRQVTAASITTTTGVAGAFTGPELFTVDIHRQPTFVATSAKVPGGNAAVDHCHKSISSRRPSTVSGLEKATATILTPASSRKGREKGKNGGHGDDDGDDNTGLSRVSTDAEGHSYPEGGLQAWLCVTGSFCGMMAALGMMNTIGTIQAYLHTNQLESYPESTVGWIFGVYAFLSFFCGIQIGPIFDAKGPIWLVRIGSILLLLSWFLLGICSQYWHFLVVFGVLGGLATSFILTPAVASIGHYFLRGRGLATGLAATGGSMGGVVFPLALQALFPRVGWAWSTRIIGFIDILLLIMANLLIRARLPPRPATKEAILPDFRIFRDPIFALTTLGIFFVEWALFIPLTYLTSYAISRGIDPAFSYQVLAILNAGSCFGRWVPGLIADKIGRFNTMIITVVVCMVSTLALWLPAGAGTSNNSGSASGSASTSSIALLIVYAVIFGFASGTGISLAPVCVGQLCKVENYGRYYATSYCVVSLACLTGIPIAGALVSTTQGAYWGLISFTGLSYFASALTFVFARGLATGWKIKAKY